MKLSKLLGLKQKDIISIVGAGGKTSLMLYLAGELRNYHKVLVTTTTKIYLPEKKQYDYLNLLAESSNLNIYNNSNGIYVLGNKINKENKIEGISREFLKRKEAYFHYILIEADGSKRKPIKGWNEDEPVIYENTTKTIGVLDIQVIGKTVNEGLVHRMDRFTELTSLEENEIITAAHLKKLVLKEKGLFKNAAGERILFINKAEKEEDFINAKTLSELIFLESSDYIDKIIIGSIKNKSFQRYEPV